MNIKTFSTIVQDQLNTISGALNKILDTAIGSVLVALAEANAGIVVWLESLVLQVLAWARASTSCGPALDSWMAQFSFTRLPGVVASGAVTFGALTAPTSAVSIPSGTLVQTPLGVQYATTASATLAVGTTSVSVPVACISGIVGGIVTNGTLGNTGEGTITQLVQSIPGIDTVTNPVAFTNGVNAEQDSAFRARFILYIGSVTKGTVLAVQNAVASYQQGLEYSVVEGAVGSGIFNVYVGNGTASGPGTPIIDGIANAIETVRPIGVTPYVSAASILVANISMTITLAAGYASSTVIPQVQTAIANYIDGIAMGGTLPFSILYSLTYGSSAGITNVAGMTLNGGTSDLTASKNTEIVPGTITVNI